MYFVYKYDSIILNDFFRDFKYQLSTFFTKISSMPGITVYMVKQGDTLWDIAKKFYTTMEEIISMNDLEDDQVSSGQPLILVKKVES